MSGWAAKTEKVGQLDCRVIQHGDQAKIAVILCHARRDPSYSGLVLTRTKKTSSSPERLQLHAPAQWSQEYPQSAYRLREEASAWQKTLWPLDFIED